MLFDTFTNDFSKSSDAFNFISFVHDRTLESPFGNFGDLQTDVIYENPLALS